jgi:hypothetical protein
MNYFRTKLNQLDKIKLKNWTGLVQLETVGLRIW